MHIKWFGFLACLFAGSIVCAQQANGSHAPIQFSAPGGHYKNGVTIALSTPNGARIHYTLDGALPNERSPVYTSPLKITSTTVVRAISMIARQASRPYTQTYLINEPGHGMPIISVAMSNSTLFHPKYGIMTDGPYADERFEHKPNANFWTRKEYLCNVEVYDSDRQVLHNSPAGFRIFGGFSRVFPQKSFVLVARKRYGSSRFDGDVLPSAHVQKFKYLVLRNGGSDWQGAHFRDELMSAIMDPWGVDKQAFRPAIVYLNGRYWGIYHLREKINTRFIADHHQVDQDSIDLLEHKNTVRAGTISNYALLLKYIEQNDLAIPEHYARVAATIDIDNYIDYQIAQFYCVNHDAGGNIRYWRPRQRNAKWRWIFFDMDWGLGLHKPEAYKSNMFKFFTEPNGPTWPNPPWSTFLLRNLLRNPQFKNRFINRMCDRLNTDFKAEHVLRHIQTLQNTIQADMPRHLSRWKQSSQNWQRSVDVMRQFATERPAYMRAHMEAFFHLGVPASVEVVGTSGGQVNINGVVSVHQNTYTGHYYEGQRIELIAKPNRGFRFVGWDGWHEEKRTISPMLKGGHMLRVKPKFERYTHPLADAVIINEVCPFNKKTGDWIEIYNTTSAKLNLNAWKISDTAHEFALPNVTIEPKGFVIICRNAQKLRSRHPLVTSPIVDGLSFGLDKAVETLILTTPSGDVIDSINYRIEPPSTEYTVDLLLPSLDNAKTGSWGVQLGMGSPGLDNPMMFAQITGSQKDLLLRIGLAIGLLVLLITAVKWKMSSRKLESTRKY